MTSTPVEKVSQEEMLTQFKDRLGKIVTENQQLSNKIKENEVTALKLQGAIETLEYYGAKGEEPGAEVDNVDIPGDDVTDGSPELTN
tara:strand:- start:914 stop:1174 length:261 start_codon:yes stop_codon:yes gene_type:complete